MKQLAVLISNGGTGTNLQSIIDAIEDDKLHAKIAVVISDKSDAIGLQRATKHKLQCEQSPKKDDLIGILKKYNVDYIVLAGWKQFIVDEVIDTYSNRILNLHPGLIPDEITEVVKNPDNTSALWNKEKYTDKAIQEFLSQKSTYAGSSIHFLTHEFDFGPVLGRCFEKVEAGDTIESLYKRLKVKENKLYVDVLMNLCND